MCPDVFSSFESSTYSGWICLFIQWDGILKKKKKEQRGSSGKMVKKISWCNMTHEGESTLLYVDILAVLHANPYERL